jgi:hypothetical protein
MSTTFNIALRQWLLTSHALNVHLSGSIHWNNAVQQDGQPYLVLQTASGDRGYVMDGPDGISGPTIQFDCYAARFMDNETTQKILLSLLDGYRGSIGNFNTQGVFFRGQSDEYDDKDKIFRTSIDFQFMFET